MSLTPSLVTPRTLVTYLGESASVSDLRGMRNGYAFELIDTATPQPLQTVVLVLNPTKYSLTEPHQSTLTTSAAGTVVDESVGVVIQDLSIEGTFGEKHRPAATGSTGRRGSGHGGELSGSEHFFQLRDLFRAYDAAKADPQRSHRTRLVFHSLREDDHIILAQPSFVTPRDKQARTHYVYRITAKGIGKAEDLQRRQVVEDEDFSFSSAIEDITEALHDATAAIVTINDAITEVKRYVSDAVEVVGSATALVGAVAKAVRDGGDLIIAFPLRTVAQIAESVADAADNLADGILDGTVGSLRNAEQSFRSLENSIDRIGMFPEHFKAGSGTEISERYYGPRGTTRQDYADGTAGATPGSSIAASFGTVGAYGLDLGRPNGVESTEVTASTTLEQLALDYNSTPEGIILQNDLRPRYISPSGGPGVVRPGDTLLIPVEAALQRGTTGAAGMDYSDPEASVFGVGFALDPTALAAGLLDVAIDTAHGGGDAVLSTGVDNLIGDLSVTFMTERGTTAFLMDVGITSEPGRAGTLSGVVLAASRLREGLLTDPRISGIASSSVTLEGDRLIQEITPIAIGKRGGIPMRLPFGTAEGT